MLCTSVLIATSGADVLLELACGDSRSYKMSFPTAVADSIPGPADEAVLAQFSQSNAGLFAHAVVRACVEIEQNDLVKSTSASLTRYYHCTGLDAHALSPGEGGSGLVGDRVYKLCSPLYALEQYKAHHWYCDPYTAHLLRHLSLLEPGARDSGVFADEMRRLVRGMCTPSDPHALGLVTRLQPVFGIDFVPVASATLPPFDCTNLILCVAGEQALLVDPSPSKDAIPHFEELLKRYLPSGLRKLFIFVTHHHHDHVAGLPLLRDMAFLSEVDTLVLAHAFTLAQISPLVPTKAVSGGECIVLGGGCDGGRPFEVIASPGHTSGHLCLRDIWSGAIFAGDHVVGQGSAVLDFRCGCMSQYLKTTEALIDLVPPVLLPAHGPPVYDGVRLLRDYVEHRLAREDAIARAVEGGAFTLQDIVKVVYVGVPEHLHPIAEGNVRLHLEKLLCEGKLDTDSPVAQFARKAVRPNM